MDYRFTNTTYTYQVINPSHLFTPPTIPKTYTVGPSYLYTRLDGTIYECEDPFPALTQNYWTSLNINWDPEDKVTWDELAVSLQELIIRKIKWEDLHSTLQARWTALEQYSLDTRQESRENDADHDTWLMDHDNILEQHYHWLKRIEKKLEELEKRIKILEQLNAQLATGAEGQVVKVAKDGSLFADDNFHVLKVGDTQSTIEILKARELITLRTVYNEWERFTVTMSTYSGTAPGYFNSRTDAQSLLYLNGSWNIAYPGGIDTIYTGGNIHCYGGFMSKQKYDNFWLEMRSVPVDGDDDMVGYIVSAIKYNGVIHTISACLFGMADGNRQSHMSRIYDANGQDCIGTVALVFNYGAQGHDYGSANQIILAQTSPSVHFAANGVATGHVPHRRHSDGYQYLWTHREGNKITIKATDFTGQGGKYGNYVTELSFKLPAVQPAWANNTQWAILKMLLSEQTQVGFCAASNDGGFQIVDQEHIFEISYAIYNIATGDVWVKIDGNWYKTTDTTSAYYNPIYTDSIPHRVWLYNPYTQELFWYQEPGVYTKILLKDRTFNDAGHLQFPNGLEMWVG